MNEITLIGNLTADPIYRVAERNARGVIHFDIAVNRRRYDKDAGKLRRPADCLPPGSCLWSLADNAKESLPKGIEVVVVGSFMDDSYEKESEKRRQLALAFTARFYIRTQMLERAD